jgi:putative transposase
MNIRRHYIPNAIVFITQVVEYRAPVFRDPDQVHLLRKVLHQVKTHHPFVMLGYVFLPDHLHMLLRPTGSSTFSDIMHSLKRNFTAQYKRQQEINGRLRFWQKGFWDHIIRDVDDLQRHLDYIHYNPVRHGLVERPEAWLDSSYIAWQARNAYPHGWGWTLPQTLQAGGWEKAE